MDLHSAVQLVASKFQYKKDDSVLLDSWFVMRDRDGKYLGDCEDFSLTVFWHVADKSLLKFLFNLLVTHKYKLYRCKDITGGWHAIGAIDDTYFDNWTLKALSKSEFFARTKHQVKMRYVAPVMVLPLIKGLFKR